MTDKLVEALERDVEWLDRFGRSVHCTVEDNDTIQRVVAFARRALSSRPAGEAVAYAGLPMSDLDLTLHYQASKNGIVDLEPSEVRQIIGELRHLRARPPREAVIQAVIEEAEQACRYVAKWNIANMDAGDYRDGFETACEVCELAIAGHVSHHDQRIPTLSAPRQPDGEAVREAQDQRRAALIARLGTFADLLSANPLEGEKGDVAYELIRQAAAQMSSDHLRLASTKAPDDAVRDKPQDHWTVKALIKAGNALCLMAETSGGTAGADPALKAAIDQWASVRRIVVYEGDDPEIGAGVPDHPLRASTKAPDARDDDPAPLRPGQRVTLRPVEDGEIVPGGDHVIASIDDGPGGGFRVHGHPNVTIWPHRIVGREAREAKHG